MSPRIHKLWPSLAVAVALIALWTGERIFDGFTGVRIFCAAVAGVGLLAAIAVRFGERGAAGGEKAQISRLILAATAAIAVGLALYALIPLVFSGDAPMPKRMRMVLWGVWPAIVAAAGAALFALEIAVFPVAFIDRYETRKVARAFHRGLGVGLLAAVLLYANVLATRHPLKWDVTAVGKTEPSQSTKTIIASLTTPIRVALFFPRSNEVAEVLDDYFRELGKPANMEIVRGDQALSGKLASETGVNENGYVVVTQGKTHEKVRIGEKLANARTALKQFDQNFAKAIIKVSRQQSVAYFTTGHGERPTESVNDDERPRLEVLKQGLQANRYEVKPLGLAEGLAHEVPKDAAVIFIMGPEKPFAPEENAALLRALDRGARIFVALQAEKGAESMDAFLSELGLKFDPTILANEQAFARVTNTDADRSFIYTNRYSSHASVTTLTRYANKLAVLFPRSGSLEKLAAVPKNTKVDLVITAMDGTFRDANANFNYDAPAEKREAFGLAAAVTRTASSTEGRVYVLADVDTVTDKFLRTLQGNTLVLEDGVYWLRDVKDPVLPTMAEDDVRIVHKRDDDNLWFYSTTIGVPVLVAAAGVVVVRRRRRR
ncbi:MAG: Gldg family protein [Myxococcota bacterium]